jgi:cell division protein FtsB
MNRDERFYAFIVATTSRSRSQIRRVSIRKRWVKVSAFALFCAFCAAGYGFYGLAQQATHLRIEQENDRLRRENDQQREKLRSLENRVDAIEDEARRLSELSGVTHEAR